MLLFNKYNLLLVFILVMFGSCKKEQSIGEEQSKTFIKFFGGNGLDYATDMIAYGNGYAFTGTMQTTDSATQAFLIATDEFGNEYSWSPVTFGGLLPDIGNKIFRLNSGDFIVVGTQVLSINGTDSCDILVTRIDTSGVIKWKKRYGGSSKEEGYFGKETSDGNLVIGGYTNSSGNGGKDICLYKLNTTNGGIIWSSVLGYSKNDWGSDIIEMNNYYYVVGTTYSISPYKKNIFIIKIDNTTGKALNAADFGLDNTDLEGIKLKSLDNSDLLVLGQYNQQSTGKFGPYLIRMNESFDETVWSNQITSSANETVSSILVTSSYFYIVGTRVGENSNVFDRTFDYNGIELGSSFLTNTGNQTGKTAVISTDGKICIAGSNSILNKSQIILSKGLF
jgi:hypothetical protein